MKKSSADEQEPQLRPGEEEGRRQAISLIVKRDKRRNGDRPANSFDWHHEQLLQYWSAPPRLRGAKAGYISTILGSLIAGYTDRFFAALRYRPDLLQDPDIWEFTVGCWSKQKLDPTKKVREQARKYLLQVGKELAAIGSGPVSEQEPETRRKNRQEKKYVFTTTRNHRKYAQRLVAQINHEATFRVLPI